MRFFPNFSRAKLRMGRAWRRRDSVLLAALALVLLFSCYGIRWGRVECWNPDEMASALLRPNFLPATYAKPPFYPYVNHIVVLWWVDIAEWVVRRVDRHAKLNEVRLIASRLLVVAMFFGTTTIAYFATRRPFGIFAARVVALGFATSAGFIAFNNYLTVDSPMLFWMMLAFLFCQRILYRGELRDYIAAGIITGLATATKYNGLAIGIAIPAAHFLRGGEPFLRRVFSYRWVIGCACVVVGFVLGNPGVVLDWSRFSSDFMYNYVVTRQYGGQNAYETSYGQFLVRITDIIGVPAACVVAVAIFIGLILFVVRRKITSLGARNFALAAAVFLLYYVQIGGFPRSETRFTLPAVPFLLLMAAPCFAFLEKRGRTLASALLTPVLLYNLVCCFAVGRRFNQDPRMAAQLWVRQHIPGGSVMESSACSPHWQRLAGFDAVEIQTNKPKAPKHRRRASTIDLRMAHVNGRNKLFSELFKDNKWVEGRVAIYEGDADEGLFTPEALARRNPSFITVHSVDYQVPSEIVPKYYADLIDGKLGYHVTFDGTTPEAPRWIYPREIDFLAGRMTILVRNDLPL